MNHNDSLWKSRNSESVRRIEREYRSSFLLLEVAMSSTSSSYPYEPQTSAPKEDATNSASLAASLPQPLLNSEEAAAVMKIHPKTLQKLARRGVVRGIHVGKLWRVRASAIEEWIESQ